MDEKRISNKILKSNDIGKRPRKRYNNTVEIDSRYILKVKNWERDYLYRKVWRRHLKEAKARLRPGAPYNKKNEKKTGNQQSV
jgi:hypothetical protein